MPASNATSAPRFLTVTVARELGILLALSLLFPFLIHILPFPEDSRIGPRLLPMFYAPLLAVLWGRPGQAAAVALLAPWLNWLITQHPPPPVSALMNVELLVFVLALGALLRRSGPRCYLTLPALLASKAAATLAALFFPALIRGRPALTWALQSSADSLPGYVIILALAWLVLHFYPPSPTGHGPTPA